MSVLLQAMKENISYEVFISQHGNTQKLAYNPLRFAAEDGSVFMLSEASETADREQSQLDAANTEPGEGALDHDSGGGESASADDEARERHIREGRILEEYGKENECIGSLLYMSNLKMHRTRGYATTTDFSKEFARAAGVKEGHVTLDLFLGLGYVSQEALNLGAERVVAFEKYTAVQNLVRRNPWSMNIDDPSLAHRFKLQTLDVQREKSLPLFRFFADYQRKGILPSLFNSVIIDPPKKKVMLYIYSKYFLENLAEWTKKGGVVAAYMPPGGLSPKFSQCREELVQTFEDTRKFEFIDCWDQEKMIWRFRRR